MNCPKCLAPVPADSAFCNKCGAALAVRAPGAPDPPEADVWTGRYSGKSIAHAWLLWFVWFGFVLYALFGLFTERTRLLLGVAAVLGLLPGLSLLVYVAYQKLSIRYRLTTHRFFKEEGILSRKINELELIRVDDVSVRQNLVQRIFNVGAVMILSTDATDPRLRIVGVESPIDVKEKIRANAQQRRSRAIHLESL